MPDHSPNLDMPFIKPSQAQKHVTHNEALEHIDALAQLTVERFNATNPPADPDPGICYALGTGATGDWAGQDGNIAYRAQNGWLFLTPKEGWRAWGINEEELRTYREDAWQAAPTDTLGVNTTADTTNRLAVAGDAALFTHDGTDHRLKINKASAADTASLLFQSEFTGHAEAGLAGGNDWSLKVSSDGSNWTHALAVDRTNGFLGVAGLTEPLVAVHASGSIRADKDGPNPGIIAYRSDSGKSACVGAGVTTSYFMFDNSGDFSIASQNAAQVHTGTAGGKTDRIIVQGSTGNVGIGIGTPSTRLDVGGPVRVKGYTVAGAPSAASSGAGAIIFVSDETAVQCWPSPTGSTGGG